MELAAAIESRMKLLEEKKNPGASNETSDGSAPAASAEVPPSRLKTADEVIAEMKKVPLFMTSMDELDEDNEQIQALKAIAYEGTRAEIAQNFRNQGNECVKFKQYPDAREFYSKAIQALKGPIQPQEPEDDDELPEQRVVEIDEEAEEKKERSIEEACYANRALCNLEMSITASPEQIPRAVTDLFRRRKLSLLPKRLRSGSAPEREECESLVSSCHGVPCHRQDPRSIGSQPMWPEI